MYSNTHTIITQLNTTYTHIDTNADIQTHIQMVVYYYSLCIVSSIQFLGLTMINSTQTLSGRAMVAMVTILLNNIPE